MNGTRTDLALETVEELRSGGDISRLDGVSVAEFTRCGYGVTCVRVEGAAAARRLGNAFHSLKSFFNFALSIRLNNYRA